MTTGMPLLSLLIWVPVLGGLLVLAIDDARSSVARWTALAISLVSFVLSLFLYAGFNLDTSDNAVC